MVIVSFLDTTEAARCTSALPEVLFYCGISTVASSFVPPLAAVNLGPLLASSVFVLSSSAPSVAVAHNIYAANAAVKGLEGAKVLLLDDLAFRDVSECDRRAAGWATWLLVAVWNVYGSALFLIIMATGNGTTLVKRFLWKMHHVRFFLGERKSEEVKGCIQLHLYRKFQPHGRAKIAIFYGRRRTLFNSMHPALSPR